MLPQDILGTYYHFVLADYITLAAAPANPTTGTSADERQDHGGEGSHSLGHGLLPDSAAALRQGACAVYGACSPAQVMTLLWSVLLIPLHSLPFRACCK